MPSTSMPPTRWCRRASRRWNELAGTCVPLESLESMRQLVAAYRSSLYLVHMSGGARVILRVGGDAPTGIGEWVGSGGPARYISACNPASRVLGADENAQRMDTLRGRLRATGCQWLEGVAHDARGEWREAGLLVRGIDASTVDALAREFGQNATLCVPGAGPVRLCIHRDDWLRLLATDDTPAGPG